MSKTLQRLGKLRATGKQSRLDTFFSKLPGAGPKPSEEKYDPFARKGEAAGKAAGKVGGNAGTKAEGKAAATAVAGGGGKRPAEGSGGGGASARGGKRARRAAAEAEAGAAAAASASAWAVEACADLDTSAQPSGRSVPGPFLWTCPGTFLAAIFDIMV